MDRRHLPALHVRATIEAAYDQRYQKEPFPAQEHLTPPEGAPNVLVILIDDMGFGASSPFGGPCQMPVAQELADQGLRYGRFHTTAMCSPTRAALLTGRNHHSVGMGQITELLTAAPGYDGMRGPDAGTLAQILRMNGYATGAFGKWHQTPAWEQTPAGPLDRWPTGEGFEKFYGFFGGEADQFTPTLIDGTTFIDPPATEEEGYHLSEDLVDQALAWIRQVRNVDRDKSWFTYLSFGATHAPFHLPKELRDNNPYRGRFGHGWDEMRERILARQKELRIVPEDTELAPWRGGVPHWDEQNDTDRAAAERLMETYAAFAEHTDAQVGKVIDFLRETGDLDNTLVFYILGDNGASTEGGFTGTVNQVRKMNGFEVTSQEIVDQLEDIGGPNSFPHFNAGWALALDTPYQWAKQVASHYGGTRNGLIVHWPRGFPARGEVRQHWHHVIDVAPTILEAAGIPQPHTINGIEQRPIEGVSMLYSFRDGQAPERHTTQYFEMFGNRGIYHENWTAVAKHRTPWESTKALDLSFDDDVWELYDTTNDWSQVQDLAAEHPEKLAELKALFESEARKYNVLPLDDRAAERLDAKVAGRPMLWSAKDIVLTPRDGHLNEDNVPNVKNTSFQITAELETTGGDNGVFVAQGGRFGGWAFYSDEGRLTYVYNDGGQFMVQADSLLEPGRHTVDLLFDYDGGGLGRGGDVRIMADGTLIGSGRVERTLPMRFSVNETLNVGIDRGSPVTDAYPPGAANRYSGVLHTVRITVAEDSQEPNAEQRLGTTLTYH